MGFRPLPESRFGAAAAVAVGVAAPLVVALDLTPAVRFPVVLAFFCVIPGTALPTTLRGRLELGLVLATSLGLTAIVAQLMLWLHLWRPEAFLYLFAALCVTPLVARLRSSGATRAWIVGVPARLQGLRRELATRTSPDTIAHVAIIVEALALWRISLTGADLGRIARVADPLNRDRPD